MLFTTNYSKAFNEVVVHPLLLPRQKATDFRMA